MKVTILIPVYNVEKYLSKCLDSVLNQTYKDLQIVLVDDGSTDGSWKVMYEYSQRDSRIEVHRQSNQGVSAARNNLLDKVKGDYVLFVDSDDWIEPYTVEYLVNTAQSCNADIVKCNMVINDTPVNTEPYEVEVWDQKRAIQNFLMHTIFRGSLWDKLVSASLYKDIRFNNKVSYGEDALAIWHVLQKAATIVVTDRQLYHYRMSETSVSHQTFGDKKLTGHLTWSIINEECAQWWPLYLHIAQARWGMEDMYLLRQAGQSHYKKDDAIREIQKTVKQFMPQMKSTGLLRGREILNANIMCRWYGYGMLYSKLNQIKTTLR